MFGKEVCKVLNKVKVVWYPEEGCCLVIRKKSKRIYLGVPKKYLKAFQGIRELNLKKWRKNAN